MRIILLLILLVTTSICHAQIGPGIVFDYDAAGYRIKRYYDHAATLAKPGKDNTGQRIDTIIGVFKNEGNLNVDKTFVKAYPNPITDILIVENMSWIEGSTATMKISDISGKEILEKTTTLPKEIIRLEMLTPGTYNLRYYINDVYIVSWQIVKL